MRHSHPRPPPTPNTGVPSAVPPSVPNPLLPSAPASPPTPAPSPTPLQRSTSWNPTGEDIDVDQLESLRVLFSRLGTTGKQAFLDEIVECCDNHLLSYLHHQVSPRLKKDPFKTLPNELCFRVRAPCADPRYIVLMDPGP